MAGFFASVGEDTAIRPPLYVDYGTHISDRRPLLRELRADRARRLRDHHRGRRADRADVQLLTPTHPVEPGPRRDKWEAGAPITIGDNVWLGGGAIVLAGVSIGDNTIVGAGAVVTKDLPANVVAVGNPARVVRALE